jgi:hypothetical protein
MIVLDTGGIAMQDETSSTSDWSLQPLPHEEGIAAHHGASVAELEAPLLLYNNRQNAIGSLNKRMMFVGPLVVIYCVLLLLLHQYVSCAIFIAFFAFLYLAVVRRFNQSVKPLMEIDSTGITIHSLLTHCHLDWNNVEDARPYRFIYRFAGINPKSLWNVQASWPVKLFLLQNSLCKTLYGLIGLKVFVINIPEQYSHLKAEEICEQIELRRQHFLALPYRPTP